VTSHDNSFEIQVREHTSGVTAWQSNYNEH